MAIGVIYAMTTVVPGLIKLGKTGIDNYDARMYQLERNGYANVTGLTRKFAIEVEGYDEKEIMLGNIFSKSKVSNTELFALDINLVIQLLSSLDGKQIYPVEKTKEEVFDEAVLEREAEAGGGYIPDGEYFLQRKVGGFGVVRGQAVVTDGKFVVKKGSVCAPTRGGFVPEIRKNVNIKNNILQEDVACTSPSSAGWVVIGRANNGWTEWKDTSRRPIDVYRIKNEL